MIMQSTKKLSLALNKKAIASLTSTEASALWGGVATNPTNTTKHGTADFPVSDYCYPNTTVVLTTGTRPLTETC
jgi:hypothetical protein